MTARIPKRGENWRHQNQTVYEIFGTSTPGAIAPANFRQWGPHTLRARASQCRTAFPATWEADLSLVWLVCNPWQPTEFWVQRCDSSFVECLSVAYFRLGRRVWVRSLENFLGWKDGSPRFQRVGSP